mmetsp:Transcript_53450/g.106372  ORF Transcript_53450/g.106372 Transcript_53450/m.106372 type:complete len:275 (-) Transcript_53450:224-1048(-)
MSTTTDAAQSAATMQLMKWFAILAVVASLSTTVSGCDMEVPHHRVGNWRKNPNYLVRLQYREKGGDAAAAQLNSCMVAGTPATLQCSGHGYCKQWNPDVVAPHPLSFCVCDRDWADPECRTRRKSQRTSFLLSLFGGFLGADYFYLGFPLWAAVKLITLGGLGFWWVVDIVRTGAGPVYAHNYRVANDLPHWIYVVSTVTLFAMVGFIVSLESYFSYRRQKRNDAMKLQESEESRRLAPGAEELNGPYCYTGGLQRSGANGFNGYGAVLGRPKF